MILTTSTFTPFAIVMKVRLTLLCRSLKGTVRSFSFRHLQFSLALLRVFGRRRNHHGGNPRQIHSVSDEERDVDEEKEKEFLLDGVGGRALAVSPIRSSPLDFFAFANRSELLGERKTRRLMEIFRRLCNSVWSNR